MESKQSKADLLAQERARALIDRVISDRYRIRELIAMGGMGAVYRGDHLRLKKRIAIKILHPETENLPELVKRFEREAIAGAHIQHPNVATATDFGTLPDGSYFLILEYVKGKTLTEVMEASGPLQPRRAALITRQMASALEAIHRMDIVHRDLKPRNVMICEGPSEVVKIIDLGLAKVKVDELEKKDAQRQESLTDDDYDRENLTVAGTIFGTIAYLAPEAAEGMDAVDARSDLYALGLILYEMLAGGRPFTAINPVELFMQHRIQPPPPLAKKNPDAHVPASLEAVVMKLLEKDPKKRYQTGQEVVAAIDEVLKELGAPSPNSLMPPPPDDSVPESDVLRSVPPGAISLQTPVPPSIKSATPPPPAAEMVQSATPPPPRATKPTLPSEGAVPAKSLAPAATATPKPSNPPPARTSKPSIPPAASKPQGAMFSSVTGAKAVEEEAPKKKKSNAALNIIAVLSILGFGAVAYYTQVYAKKAPKPPAANPVVSAAPSAAAPKTGASANTVPASATSAASNPAPSSSAAAAPTEKLSPEEVEELRRKIKNAWRFRDWRGAGKAAIELGLKAPEVYKENEMVMLVQNVAIALSKEQAEGELMQVLADDLGSEGLDVLYGLIEGQGKSPIADKAAKLLADPKRMERASPAMRFALEFRNAPCNERLKMIDQAAEVGDTRARIALETVGKACFPDNPNLNKAIYALRAKYPNK